MHRTADLTMTNPHASLYTASQKLHDQTAHLQVMWLMNQVRISLN